MINIVCSICLEVCLCLPPTRSLGIASSLGQFLEHRSDLVIILITITQWLLCRSDEVSLGLALGSSPPPITSAAQSPRPQVCSRTFMPSPISVCLPRLFLMPGTAPCCLHLESSCFRCCAGSGSSRAPRLPCTASSMLLASHLQYTLRASDLSMLTPPPPWCELLQGCQSYPSCSVFRCILDKIFNVSDHNRDTKESQTKISTLKLCSLFCNYLILPF